MSTSSRIGGLAVCLLCACGDGAVEPETVFLDAGSPLIDGGVEVPCASVPEAEVIVLVNEARAASGAGAVACDADLGAVSRAHSQDMCDNNYFSHTSQDGASPFDRMAAAGIRYRAAGENIARGQPTALTVHEAWMGSEGHRANILDGAYGRIGVGYVVCSGARQHFWTQVFAD